MVTLEASYRGSGSFSAYDGTVHAQKRIATPNHVSGGHGQLRDGQGFTEEIVFEVPADTPEGGHFVITEIGSPTEDGTWVDAA